MSRVVLVTGAGGFVGSAVVRLLAGTMSEGRPVFSGGARIDHVIALLRPGGSPERLEDLPRTTEWSIRFADLADGRALERLLAELRPCAIVHAALDSKTYHELSEPEQQRLNLGPLEALFQGLSGTTSARFVHTGSAWVLPSGQRLNERVALEPNSVYARSKAEVDRCLPALGDRTGVPWINLRLFNLFGRYEAPSRLLPYLVAKLTEGHDALLSHGSQIRDFNDVDDVAHAYRLALEAPESACGAVYHIGSGRGTAVRDFASMVAKFTGGADRIRFEASQTSDQDVPCLVADPALAQQILGWSPSSDLEARVRRAAEWWLDRRVRAGSPPLHPGVSR